VGQGAKGPKVVSVSVISTATRSFLLCGLKLNRVGISSLRIVNYFWTSRLGKCAKFSPICPSVSHSGSQSVKCAVIASQSICGSYSDCLEFLFLVSGCLHHGWIYDLHKKSLANSFPTFTFCLPDFVFFSLPLFLSPLFA